MFAEVSYLARAGGAKTSLHQKKELCAKLFDFCGENVWKVLSFFVILFSEVFFRKEEFFWFFD